MDDAPLSFQRSPFDFEKFADGMQYTAYFLNNEERYGSLSGTKNGNSLIYLRDIDLLGYREDLVLAENEKKLIADFSGEFIDINVGLKSAMELLEAFNLSNMQLIESQKMCFYKNVDLYSRGWEFVFTHGCDGLPTAFDETTTIIPNFSNSMIPTYHSPWGQEAVKIVIDNNGIVCIELRNVIQYEKRLATNIILLSFDEFCDLVIEFLGKTYSGQGENLIVNITEFKLCASLINAKDSLSSGRLLPTWVVSYEVWEKTDDAAIQLKEKYSRYFNAIDGSYIEPRVINQFIP